MTAFRHGQKVRLRPEACERVLTVLEAGPDNNGDAYVVGMSERRAAFISVDLLELVPEPRLLGPDTELHDGMRVNFCGRPWKYDEDCDQWTSGALWMGTRILYNATILDGPQ